MLKVAGVAALLLTLLWLLSPGRSTAKSEPGVVEISFMAGGPLAGALDDAVRAFEAESRAAHGKNPAKPIYHVVSGQNASRNQSEDPTRFVVSVAGGLPPDVIRFDRYAVTEWAARKAFEPLDGFLQKDAEAHDPDAIRAENYYRSCWDEVVYQNPDTGKSGIYAIPESADDRALFYNTDLLKRAGFVDEKGDARPPKTWEELETMAVKLTEHDEQGRITRLGFAPNYGNSWLYIYGWMNGGEFMSADGKRCTLNDPRIVDALAWMTRVYDSLGGVKPVSAFQSSFQSGQLDPFLMGKIVMKIDGFWQIGDTLAQFGKNVSYAAAPPPMPAAEVAKGRKTLSWIAGFSYAIPASAAHKEAAWELIRFLSSDRARDILNESNRLTMESQGRIFVPGQLANISQNEGQFKKYVFDKPGMDPKVVQAVATFNALIPESRYRPVTPVGQLLWNEHITALENGINHIMSPQAALDLGTLHVQRDLDRALAPPQGTPINWNYFFVGYIALLIALAVGVFYWDTRAGFRLGLGRFFGAGGKATGMEGVQTAFFRSQWRGGWICALPWIMGFIIFTGGPILFSIIVSFCEYDVLSPARFSGLANYRWMFSSDPLFYKSLWNTLYMVIGIPLGMALSLGIAMLLNQKINGIAVWRTFFYLPSIVPAVASSILWIWILNPNGGLLNTALASIGIHGPNWLQDQNTSKPALILMGLWGAGGGMIIWIAGLKGISESYYEAASLDGATPWQQFLHVTLPMLSPYIFFNLIMGLIGTFQIFTQAFIMTQGGPVNSTMFYAYHLFNNAFRFLHMGYAAAMAWVLFIIILGLTVLQMKLSNRWVHYESD